MGYSEFVETIQKWKTRKIARIRNSWGVYDAYKMLRKNKWYNIGRSLRENEFYSIIRGVNKLLADELANGNDIHFPHGMGVLELRKSKRGVRLVDGKLKNNYPVDWKETLQLWYNDEEAMNNKTLARKESKVVYYVMYNKHDANYENQCFYEFALNRFIKKTLKENINKGKIDTLW